MKNTILSGMWWKAAVMRALRTAAVIATPYVPTVLYDQNYLIVLSAAGFGAVTSLLTSLFNIPETTDKSVSWYWALGERVIKTTAQALITLFGTATLFEDVAWAEAPQLVGTAILGSLLLAFMKGMPEAPEPPAKPATITVNEVITDHTGEPAVVQSEAPVVAQAKTDLPPLSGSVKDQHDGITGV